VLPANALNPFSRQAVAHLGFLPRIRQPYLGLDRLSVAERILLVEELWDSIIADTEAVSLTEAQKLDLWRRLDAYRDNPKAGSSWEDVKARLHGDMK
jgi:putative addiction module component (TIGR02574 family)